MKKGLLILVLLVANVGMAQSIASLELGTTSYAGVTNGSATFTTKDPNLSAFPVLSLTAAQQGQAGGAGYVSSKTWNVTTQNTGDYWEFTLTASGCYQIVVTSITIRGQRSGTGPTDAALRSSADAYGANIGAVTSLQNNSNVITFSGLTLSGLSSVTFRVYGWETSGGAATGTWRIGDGANGSLDIDVLGSLTNCGGGTSITTGAVSTSPFDVDCSTSATGTVNFTSAGTFNAGNVYTAQLSDATGSFASPTNIGTLSSTGNSGTINITIPANTSGGSGYQIQIVASNPSTTGNSSSAFTINNSCVSTYPVLTGIIVDGCNTYTGSTPSCATTFDNTNCTEGRSEVTFFRNGSTAITSAQVQAMTRHVIDYYTTAWSTLTYYTGVSMNNTATTSSLNSSGCNSASCGSCFIDAWSNGIPANATFIMVADYYCIGSTDYTNLCNNNGTNPIYVIYFGASTNNSSNCQGGTTGVWDVSGNYTNYSGTSTVKGIAIDMSSLVAGAPMQYYTYNISNLANCSGASDGAGIAFNGVSTSTASPTTPNAYTSCACNIPITLPVQLLEFTGHKTNDGIMLKWSTSTEINCDYFDVEYSPDGVNFSSYKKIKGAGNSNQTRNYACLFTMNTGNQDLYFRLKQVDYNGGYEYSYIITATEDKSDQIKSTFNSGNNIIVSDIHSESQQLLNISLYDISGDKVNEKQILINKGSNSISLDGPENGGIYVLVYTLSEGAPYHKKMIISK